MKSDIIILKKDSDISAILNEVEAVAAYRKLDKQPALRLRLLAEELVSVLPNLLKICEGKFWIDNTGTNYELHLEVSTGDSLILDRDRILELSKSGKNVAYKGIMGKIRFAVEMMINTSAASCVDPISIDAPFFYSAGLISDSNDIYNSAWTLQNYQSAVNSDKDERAEEWDELEKSIIGNIADDVIVGVSGSKANIIVKKQF